MRQENREDENRGAIAYNKEDSVMRCFGHGQFLFFFYFLTL